VGLRDGKNDAGDGGVDWLSVLLRQWFRWAVFCIWIFASVSTPIGSVRDLQEDPEWTLEKEMCVRRGVAYVAPERKEKADDPEYMREEASSIPVGARCEVDPGGKRGIVRQACHLPNPTAAAQLDRALDTMHFNRDSRVYAVAFRCKLPCRGL
jgi:hypothetical protein